MYKYFIYNSQNSNSIHRSPELKKSGSQNNRNTHPIQSSNIFYIFALHKIIIYIYQSYEKNDPITGHVPCIQCM